MLGKYQTPTAIACATILAFSTLSFINPQLAESAATHVVISEVQIAGGSSTDEFVELYNPTGSAVNLNGFRLGRKTAAGTDATDLVTSLTGTIASHGYFLIAADNYDGVVTEDVTYTSATSAISDNNTVLLFDNTTALVDKIGFGTAVDFEADSEPNPSANGSRERKALATSTIASMGVGGIDEFLGNGEDTDNNENDFVSRAASDPQNAQSNVEPSVAPTPTPSPTLSPSPIPSASPTPSASATPTISPTATADPTPTATTSASPTSTPTSSPTATPSVTPSPTPTATPLATPTLSPTPTVAPSASPTITPTASPSASPTAMPTKTPKPYHNFSCQVKYVSLSFGFFRLRMPMLICGFHF